MSVEFKTNAGLVLSYDEASEVVRYLLAEHLGVHPDKLVFLMVDVSDAFLTKTYFHVELDGGDPPPEVEQRIRQFVRSLGFGQLGMEDVATV